MSEIEKIRVDKWLWAARFFKTRSAAAVAANGGKVHVNGQRVKSSRPIQLGDELEITRGQVQSSIVVMALSDKRGPAKLAQALFEETPESIQLRELKSQQRKLLNSSISRSQGKPDKHQRRQIRKASGKSS